jgi:glutamyl-Q tRNA(Asp) synthetase
LFAYHLAVVTDDADQAITHILRGTDLLDSTPIHLCLQQQLGFPKPRYLHLPLLLNADGQKLSKQNHAAPLPRKQHGSLLHQMLHILGQHPPTELRTERASTVLEWAIAHWNAHAIPRSPILFTGWAIPEKRNAAQDSIG